MKRKEKKRQWHESVRPHTKSIRLHMPFRAHTQTIGSNAKRYHRNETTNHATTFSLAFKIMIPAYFGVPVLPTTSVLTLSRRHPQS